MPNKAGLMIRLPFVQTHKFRDKGFEVENDFLHGGQQLVSIDNLPG